MTSTEIQRAYGEQNQVNPKFRAETVALLDEEIREANRKRAAGKKSWEDWHYSFKNLGAQIALLPRTPEVAKLVDLYNSSYAFSSLS